MAGLSGRGAVVAVNDNAIAVMVKAPVPGSVKTRLVPPLTREQAARLYECLVKDTFASIAAIEGVDIYAAYLGPLDAISGMVPQWAVPIAQRGDGLGERMYDILKRLFERGYARCAVVGSDLPDLPARYVEEAFALIEGDVRLALGPATDGGYYLVACDGPYEPIFTGMRYSTPTVLQETMAKARENNIRYALVSPWHDIDTFEDLLILRANPCAPESSRFVEGLLP